MSARHPFVTWVIEKHGKADTPLGNFARNTALALPATGDRDELRARLGTTDDWTLACFDVSFSQYMEHEAGELL
jgi:hypothetical protein